MIYQVRGYIIRKTWGFKNPVKPKHGSITAFNEKLQGTLCFMSGQSEDEVKQKVTTEHPEFTIETITLVSDDQILTMLKRQQIV